MIRRPLTEGVFSSPLSSLIDRKPILVVVLKKPKESAGIIG
ncbi:hypothetical protein [Polaromonas sp. CG9_12]|nr:hypothetical protein [Polaromonas sp. CG9_12]